MWNSRLAYGYGRHRVPASEAQSAIDELAPDKRAEFDAWVAKQKEEGNRITFYMDGPGVTAETRWGDMFTIRMWMGYD